MTSLWSKFIAALELKGYRFEDISYASDPLEIIKGVGFQDPFQIAHLETQWRQYLLRRPTEEFRTDTVVSGDKSVYNGRKFRHVDPIHGSSSSVVSDSHPLTRNEQNKNPSRVTDVPPFCTSVPSKPQIEKACSTSSSLSPSKLGSSKNLSNEKSNDKLNISYGRRIPASVDDFFTLSRFNELNMTLSPKELFSAPEKIQDMILTRELLNALLGQTGEYIILENHGGLVCTENVPLAMRGLLQSVLPIGEAFYVLRYVERVELSGKSLVTMALGEVVSEIMAAYARQIAVIQRKIQDQSRPLIGVLCEVERFGHWIKRLKHIIPFDSTQASASCAVTMSGGMLLNHLYEQWERYAASIEDRRLLTHMLKRVSIPYFALLQKWMTEGILDDPFNEFFISELRVHDQRNRQNKMSHYLDFYSSIAEGFSDSINRVDIDFPLTAIFFSEDLGTTNSSTRQDYSLRGKDISDAAAFERRFTLNQVLIPLFFLAHGQMAKTILYTGRYACLLREFGESVPDNLSLENRFEWNNVDSFHSLINDIYFSMSKAVLRLFHSPRVDLIGHLNSIKKFFLHARGDWFIEFLDSAEQLLFKSAVQVKVHSLRVLLQVAIAKTCPSDPYHSIIGCFLGEGTLEHNISKLSTTSSGSLDKERTITEKSEGEPIINNNISLEGTSSLRVDSRNCVDLLQLTISLKWPLTLVLEAITIKNFNACFQLLVCCKSCERLLYNVWHRRSPHAKAHRLKHQMVSFLRQFQFYAVHFVIEPLWGRMIEQIQKAQSMIMLHEALTQFFDEVRNGLFLSSTYRYRYISSIFDLIYRFCEAGKYTLDYISSKNLDASVASFEKEFLENLRKLASFKGSENRQIIPIFMFLDFSRYYESKGIFHTSWSETQLSGILGSAESHSSIRNSVKNESLIGI